MPGKIEVADWTDQEKRDEVQRGRRLIQPAQAFICLYIPGLERQSYGLIAAHNCEDSMYT